jgi:hypothetical protein
MTQDHFLQAAARITRVVHVRLSAEPGVGREVRTLVNASSKGGDWRITQAEMPSPGVTLPGPFVTPPSPGLPVATRWLLTPVENCGVRARCSVRLRSRTGRFRRFFILLSSPLLFFCW